MSQNERIQQLLENTEPLTWPRGNRTPLYLWSAIDVEMGDDTVTEWVLHQHPDQQRAPHRLAIAALVCCIGLLGGTLFSPLW